MKVSLFKYFKCCLSVYPSIHPSIHPPTHPSIHPSTYLTYLFPIRSSFAPTIPSHHLLLITVRRLNMWGYRVLYFFPSGLRFFEAPESPKDGRTKGPREQRTREPGDQRGAREGPERDQRGTREGPERDQRGTRGRKDQRNDREIHKP